MTWSYTRISTFETCPAKYNYKYVQRLPEKGEKSPALVRGIEIHEQGEQYLKGKLTRLPKAYSKTRGAMERLKRLGAEAEEWWHVDQNWEPTPSWSWLCAKTDAWCVPKEGIVEVVDFKTGRMYPNHRDQLHLYAACAMSLFDCDKVITRAIYVDIGQTLDFEWYPRKLKTMQNNWESRVNRIEKAKRFQPQQNFFCRWCPYSKKEGGPCVY